MWREETMESVKILKTIAHIATLRRTALCRPCACTCPFIKSSWPFTHLALLSWFSVTMILHVIRGLSAALWCEGNTGAESHLGS